MHWFLMFTYDLCITSLIIVTFMVNDTRFVKGRRFMAAALIYGLLLSEHYC